MFLDDSKIPSPAYDILEAASRIGGRVYTRCFSEELHDYYGMGSMRYPDIPTMERTSNLFKLTKTPLLLYYLGSKSNYLRTFSACPFNLDTVETMEVMYRRFDNVDKILKDVFGAYKKALCDTQDRYRVCQTHDCRRP
ncbi:hypothetical protein F4814DRAFT_414283 [Daldinia grandis]|nr:hypothetical protein F4814DRAFT_414283 [Daldinia grandis]